MIARTAHAYRPAVAEVGTDHQGDDVRGFADLASLAPGHCPMTTKIARPVPLTCDEESSLSIHGGPGARFDCFL